MPMKKSLWMLRMLFLGLCTLAGYAVSQNSELIEHGNLGIIIGFGFGWLMIAVDEMTKGLSVRLFSAASAGLALGAVVAWLVQMSGIFDFVDDRTRWVIHLALYLGFGYIGMILAMRSNKEDFTLIIPFVRFAPQQPGGSRPLVMDTSVIIDGRIAELVGVGLFDSTLVIPRFVLKELQQIADSSDPIKRGRGRRGLDMIARMQDERRIEIKIHEAEVAEETGVDAKLIRLTRLLEGRLVTNDHNLSRLAEIQGVARINLNELAQVLKPVLLPGDSLSLKIIREGRDKGQGVGFLPDGTMIVVAEAAGLTGQTVDARVVNVIQTGTGKMIFAEIIPGAPPALPVATDAVPSPS